MFATAGTSTASRFSVKSSSHSGRSCKLFLAASLRQFPGASSLLREFAAFDKIDESCGDVEEEPLLKLDVVQGPPGERSSQSCIGFSSHLLPDVAFDHWPTHKCNRALRGAFLMTGLQECFRATAQSRRDEDRALILVLPRSSALSQRPSPPLWSSWISAEFPVHVSLDLFAQHVHGHSGVDCEFSLFWLFRRGCRHYPGSGKIVERIVASFFDLDILCQVPEEKSLLNNQKEHCDGKELPSPGRWSRSSERIPRTTDVHGSLVSSSAPQRPKYWSDCCQYSPWRLGQPGQRCGRSELAEGGCPLNRTAEDREEVAIDCRLLDAMLRASTPKSAPALSRSESVWCPCKDAQVSEAVLQGGCRNSGCNRRSTKNLLRKACGTTTTLRYPPLADRVRDVLHEQSTAVW